MIKGKAKGSSQRSSTGKPERVAQDACDALPYNRYNIYFILERERFLQSNAGYRRQKLLEKIAAVGAADGKDDGGGSPDTILTGYEQLDLPDLPQRYASVVLPRDWYSPAKRKMTKRSHKKSHGIASFREIARVVADGWRDVDESTLSYCRAVAEIQRERYDKLQRMKRSGRVAVASAESKKAPAPSTGTQQLVSDIKMAPSVSVMSSSDFVATNSPGNKRALRRASNDIDWDGDQDFNEGLPNLVSSLEDDSAPHTLYVDISNQAIIDMYLS